MKTCSLMREDTGVENMEELALERRSPFWATEERAACLSDRDVWRVVSCAILLKLAAPADGC